MTFSEAIGTVLELATWRIEEMPDEMVEFKTESTEACDLIASFMERWEGTIKDMERTSGWEDTIKLMEGDGEDK